MSLWQESTVGKPRITNGTSTTPWPLTEAERKLMLATNKTAAKSASVPEKSAVADGSQLWQSHKPAPHAWRE